jgi:hypothetical protein
MIQTVFQKGFENDFEIKENKIKREILNPLLFLARVAFSLSWTKWPSSSCCLLRKPS